MGSVSNRRGVFLLPFVISEYLHARAVVVEG